MLLLAAMLTVKPLVPLFCAVELSYSLDCEGKVASSSRRACDYASGGVQTQTVGKLPVVTLQVYGALPPIAFNVVL